MKAEGLFSSFWGMEEVGLKLFDIFGLGF